MDLGFAGQAAVGVDFGFTVAVDFGGGFEVRIETPFTLRLDEFDGQIEPGHDSEASIVARLSGQVVSLAIADDAGWLRIDLTGGGRLLAGPDSSFEAWTVSGPDGFKVVCGPGGQLSVWSPQHD